MLGSKFDIVIGDDSMALYRDGKLVTAATKLTFYDILEGVGVSCDIWEGDLELYNDPTKFPPLLDAVEMEKVEIAKHVTPPPMMES